MAIVYEGELGTHVVLNATGSSETVTLASGATVGSTVVLRVGTRDTSVAGCSVADSRGNTWTIDVGPLNTGNNFVAIASTRQDVGTLQAADTVTFTWGTAPSQGIGMIVDEFSGLETATYVDQTANANSAVPVTSSPSGTTGTTTLADEVAVTAYCLGLATIGVPVTVTGDGAYSDFATPGVEWSNAVDGFPKQLHGQYKILTATGAQSATITHASVNSYQGLIVTYKQFVAPVPGPALRVTRSNLSLG